MKILKIGLNSGGLNKRAGVEKAPDAIIKHVDNFYHKEDGLLPVNDVVDVEIDNSDIEKANSQVSEAVSALTTPAILIGGDHSMTYSSFKEFSKRYQNPGLIVFDAHLDCENDFRPPTHEDYLRVLIEEGHLKKENAMVVAIRNMHTNEIDYAKEKKLKTYSMKEIANDGIRDVCDAVMSVAKSFDALYVSVDIDALDPAFAPGTGYIEPGGLTTRELLYFIQRLKNLKNIRMWDLVEVNPEKDRDEHTSITAAKLIVEMS